MMLGFYRASGVHNVGYGSLKPKGSKERLKFKMSLQGLLFAGALILPSISFGEKTSLKSLSHPLGRYRLRVLQDGTVMEAASCMVTRSASQWLGEGSKALPGANGAEAGAVRGVGRHPAGWEHIGLKA